MSVRQSGACRHTRSAKPHSLSRRPFDGTSRLACSAEGRETGVCSGNSHNTIRGTAAAPRSRQSERFRETANGSGHQRRHRGRTGRETDRGKSGRACTVAATKPAEPLRPSGDKSTARDAADGDSSPAQAVTVSPNAAAVPRWRRSNRAVNHFVQRTLLAMKQHKGNPDSGNRLISSSRTAHISLQDLIRRV
jgi:hypothetical protein